LGRGSGAEPSERARARAWMQVAAARRLRTLAAVAARASSAAPRAAQQPRSGGGAGGRASSRPSRDRARAAALLPVLLPLTVTTVVSAATDGDEQRALASPAQGMAALAEAGAGATPSAEASISPALVYEVMVKMHCEGCAKAVRNALSQAGLEVLSLDLGEELVVVRGGPSTSGQSVLDVLTRAGRTARLVGASAPGEVALAIKVPAELGPAEENVSCVAEFKGDLYGHNGVVGVVRVVQQSSTSSQLQASLAGLEPQHEYSLAVHVYGDPRPGMCGPVMDQSGAPPAESVAARVGFLGSARADGRGALELTATQRVSVWDIIGRGMAVHSGDLPLQPVALAVLARSAIVGANHKKVCTCDGTVIWQDHSQGKF
jgi:copper chaperone for superoxide dismutase